jgi:hypothetical protein
MRSETDRRRDLHRDTIGAVHGADLALEWAEDIELRRGPLASERPILFIVNHGSFTWESDDGEYWAYVRAFDAQTGERMPSGPVAVGGVGRGYRLASGERVAVGAAFSPILDELPAGEYEFEAVIPELGLRSVRRHISVV